VVLVGVPLTDDGGSDTVVGQIEAMKLYTEITAGCNGVIAEVLVTNEQSVEYGQVLFRVDPTA